jgi:plasmid maintenance system antidote protein VapI
MTHKNEHDPVDEMLRMFYLESILQYKEENIFTDPIHYMKKTGLQTSMPDAQKKLLFSTLIANCEPATFGALLKAYLKKGNLDVPKLAEDLTLPANRLNELVDDAIFSNSIPVRLMKELLNKLNIPFNLAKKTILGTFKHLQDNPKENVVREPAVQYLTYRRSSLKGTKEMPAYRDNNSNKMLFENEEALEKYLSRLEELMNE